MPKPTRHPIHAGKRHRDEARELEQGALKIGAVASVLLTVHPERVKRAAREEQLLSLRRSLRELKRVVRGLEAAVAGEAPSICGECSSRFYPSRSDAVYCGPTCRMRAHRRLRRAR